MEAVNSMRPLPTFDYVPIEECESSHRHAPAESLLRSDEVREIARLERNGWSRERNHDRSMGVDARQACQAARGRPMNSVTTYTPYATRSRRTAGFEEKLQPMTAALKPHNARKYCELHEQNGHTIAECRELKKALHELTDKGQIDRFLKRGPRSLHKGCDTACTESREECSTEILAIIVGGYAEGITRATWKAQMRRTQ
ncbi:hypothetical protein Cgig2_027206 [Carnegiea gigantea]|uniref:Reverse transcriptase domain-containing protein n=1 Tax=Carnegiea gigantea TaxID=171969 RepID=A0A9Q1GLN4_9CARY|nr:hypothetical protein Cgig2_027206 [Carnegiea gigantea]